MFGSYGFGWKNVPGATAVTFRLMSVAYDYAGLCQNKFKLVIGFACVHDRLSAPLGDVFLASLNRKNPSNLWGDTVKPELSDLQ